MLIVGVRHSNCSLIEGAGKVGWNAEGRGTEIFPDAVGLLGLFHERDFAQAALVLQISESGYPSSAKRMGVRPSSEQVAIMNWEIEQREVIPLKDMNVGLW
jgi:hypothetical protein